MRIPESLSHLFLCSHVNWRITSWWKYGKHSTHSICTGNPCASVLVCCRCGTERETNSPRHCAQASMVILNLPHWNYAMHGISILISAAYVHCTPQEELEIDQKWQLMLPVQCGTVKATVPSIGTRVVAHTGSVLLCRIGTYEFSWLILPSNIGYEDGYLVDTNIPIVSRRCLENWSVWTFVEAFIHSKRPVYTLHIFRSLLFVVLHCVSCNLESYDDGQDAGIFHTYAYNDGDGRSRW